MVDDLNKIDELPVEAPKDPKEETTQPKRRAEDRSGMEGLSHLMEEEREQEDLQNVVFSCPVDHDGTAVYVKGWLRPGTEKPPLIIVHDLGENVGFYREAARQFWNHGFSVFGFDLRGHGRSGRMMGHIPHFGALVNDLLQVVNWIRHKSERASPFIIGQGLGALISVYFQRSYPKLCPATALLSPCLTRPTMSLIRRVLIRSLAEVSPTTRLPKGLTPRPFMQPSSSKRSQFHGMTANFAKEILASLDAAPLVFRDFSAPALIICPMKDTLLDYDRVFEMVGRHPRKAKLETREIESSDHNLLSADSAHLSEVVDMMAAWFDAQDRKLAELRQIPRQAATARPEDSGNE